MRWKQLGKFEAAGVVCSANIGVGLLATLSIHKTVSIYYLHILHPLRWKYFILDIYLSTVHDTLQFFQIQSFAFLLTCQNIQKSFMNCRQSKKLVCVLPCTKLSWMKTVKEVRTVCALGSVIFYTRVVYTLQGTGHVLPHTTQAGSLTISWLPATSLCSNLDQGNIVSRYLSNWIPIIYLWQGGKALDQCLISFVSLDY